MVCVCVSGGKGGGDRNPSQPIGAYGVCVSPGERGGGRNPSHPIGKARPAGGKISQGNKISSTKNMKEAEVSIVSFF
jgi:hypothetical protein